jgi:hypothetical protein
MKLFPALSTPVVLVVEETVESVGREKVEEI